MEMAKKTHFTHLILAILKDMDGLTDLDNPISEAIYHESSEPKTIGDFISYEGKQMVVVIAGGSKKAVVEEINHYIGFQNKAIKIQREFYNSALGMSQMQELTEILEDLEIRFSK
jgi:hypothetical protein